LSGSVNSGYGPFVSIDTTGGNQTFPAVAKYGLAVRKSRRFRQQVELSTAANDSKEPMLTDAAICMSVSYRCPAVLQLTVVFRTLSVEAIESLPKSRWFWD
jgi:hypothetical protein